MFDRLLQRRRGPTAADREAAWRSNSRARAARYGVAHEDVTRAEIWRASNGRCHRCGRPWAEGAEWQPDHLSPVSRGGLHVLANLRVCCPQCNRRKGAAVRPPPPAIRDAARAIAWHASRRLTKPGARVLPLCRPVAITKAPQCYTVALACNPHDIPKLLQPETVEIITGALGLQAPVAIVRDGARVAVQVPFARPELVRLATMPAENGRVGLGIDTGGRILAVDLANTNTAHAFIAGSTGSGKTSLAQAWIALLARANTPEALRIVGIDVKQELFTGPLASLPHLLYRVATTPEEGAALVAWVKGEIDRRMDARCFRPRILLALDEAWSIDASDLEAIARLGRSLGVHLLAMSQRGVSGDLQKGALTQFGVRICGLLGPDDGWTARNMGAQDLYPALLRSGDFAALIAGDPTRTARRFQAAYAPPHDPFWSHGWPDPATPPAIPRGRKAPPPAARPARMTFDALVDLARREYRGRLSGEAIRLWSIEHGLNGPGKGIGSDTAKAIADALRSAAAPATGTGATGRPTQSPTNLHLQTS